MGCIFILLNDRVIGNLVAAMQLAKQIVRLSGFSKNGLETKISRTFLDFLHLGHEFFVISGHGT